MPVKSFVLASVFSIEAQNYANFTFDAETATLTRNVILAFAIGVILAALAAFYHKSVPGAIVRSLLRAEALSPETAKTAEELSLHKNFFYRYELRRNITLKKLILSVEATETAADGEEYTVLRYYIPEEKKYHAETRFEKKGSGPIGLLLTAALTVVAAILLIRAVPVALKIIDNMMK